MRTREGGQLQAQEGLGGKEPCRRRDLGPPASRTEQYVPAGEAAPLWRSRAAPAADSPHCPRPVPRSLRTASEAFVTQPRLAPQAAGRDLLTAIGRGYRVWRETVRGACYCLMEQFSTWLQGAVSTPRGRSSNSPLGEAGPLQPGEHGLQAPHWALRVGVGSGGGRWGRAWGVEFACGGLVCTFPASSGCPLFPGRALSVPGGFSGLLASSAPSLAL